MRSIDEYLLIIHIFKCVRLSLTGNESNGVGHEISFIVF